MADRAHPADAGALDFAPAILRVQHENAAPLPRMVLYIALALFAVMLAWACFGRLDIIAVAQAKLIPGTYVKIVQPADSGVVREILVKDGQEVQAGQVLMRMDTQVSDADSATVDNDLNLRRLQLRRIQAELNSAPFAPVEGDPPAMFQQVLAQHRANREAYRSQLDSEQAVLAKSEQDLKGAMEMESRLKQTVPIYLKTGSRLSESRQGGLHFKTCSARQDPRAHREGAGTQGADPSGRQPARHHRTIAQAPGADHVDLPAAVAE